MTASTSVNRTRQIQAVLASLPILALAASAVAYLLTKDSLPDRIASHFSGSEPDGSMPVGELMAVCGVLWVLGAAPLVALAAYRKPLPPAVAATTGFLGAFFVWLGSGLFASTVLSQQGLESWRDASPWPVLVGGIVPSLLLGVGGASLAAKLPIADSAPASEADRPTMDLAQGQQAVWTATLHSRMLELVALAVGFVCLVLLATLGWNLALAASLAVTVVALFAIARIQVRADSTGLQVSYGILPWPTTRVPLDRIDSASVIDVRPREWGGWGYRGSLKLMRRAAVVLRAGPGIRLDLDDGKVFVVTIDNPETPVALLNAKVKRLATA